MANKGLRITITGIVQGVGFRPFVYNLANRLNLTGWVNNTSSGVQIEVHGTERNLEIFVETLKADPPPLSQIDQFTSEFCPTNGHEHFEIRASQPLPGDYLPISPDVAICDDCRRELFDPNDRRYHYPFINCTNCGPRFTIIEDIPYDRPSTTMACFEMCSDCYAEYTDPADRRFHAQPIACPACGPQVWLEIGGEQKTASYDAIKKARELLHKGKIVAIKGLGGFHLACDAANPAAVAELRKRKQRSEKPFALMAFDLKTIRKYCQVTTEEKATLESRESPIVLLKKRPDCAVPPIVAPGQSTLGFMLPYTPLHLLLMEPDAKAPEILVMTSGNLSEEPIAWENEAAVEKLGQIADAFLLHNRPIRTRCDDSVVELFEDELYFIRRSRGYAPNPIRLPWEMPPALAGGAELKNTFCLTQDKYAFLSHHIGDMENFETLQSFEEGVTHYQRLFRIEPEAFACDLHPEYLATKYIKDRAARENKPVFEIQHHHAHLAACLADNNYDKDEPVIGVCFDGTGYGTDQAIWGGEFLTGNYSAFERPYHLAYAPLAGGDLAVRKPARMALAHLWAAGIDWDYNLPSAKALCMEERTVIHLQLKHKINSPPTSSMGRLFDAVSSLLDIRQAVDYEGQAAIEMEALADPREEGFYSLDVHDGVIDPKPLLESVLTDWSQGVLVPIIAARFHNSIVLLARSVCDNIRRAAGIKTIALSGGVWQNRLLLQKTFSGLRDDGFEVLVHRRVPTNDGGIALGQAAILSKMIKR